MHYQILHIIGQSNAGPRNLVSGITPSDYFYPRILHTTEHRSVLGWRNLHAGAQTHEGSQKFGLELAMGVKLMSKPGNWAIVQHGNGSTDLASEWLTPSGAEWVSWVALKDAAEAALTAAGHTFSHDVVVWIQGEKDAQDATKSGNYAANLTTNKSAARTELSNSSLKWINLKLSAEAIVNFPFLYGDDVNTAFDTVAAADSLCFNVNTDGAPLIVESPDIHYNLAGHQQNATAIAALI